MIRLKQYYIYNTIIVLLLFLILNKLNFKLKPTHKDLNMDNAYFVTKKYSLGLYAPFL